MDSKSANSTTMPHGNFADVQSASNFQSGQNNSTYDTSAKLSSSGISPGVKNLKIPPPFPAAQDDGKSPLTRFTGGLGMLSSPKACHPDDIPNGSPISSPPGFLGTFTKGLMDSSKNAVKAVQIRARHAVSQNKRRYQEGDFDLDMSYITENIIGMGFPAGDMSSGLFGYFEGFYRNHMEEVINFFETHHKDKYKVYNLCSERLYDASLFEGKVASFPFDDHNCPPIQLITSFCKSAYSWLKADIDNVVVVHCKAGMARTGLMISSLLLYLKFFPTSEECMDFYNQKRCVDGKGLVLPSQIRYVKYFERILNDFDGQNQPGRRCFLRGFRLYRCPYWIRPSITVSDHNGVLFSTKKHSRTKDLSPEEFWFRAAKKGVMVFALPGAPCLTELSGDFKIHFHDRQGDFYCWLNTTMIENRKILTTFQLDGFDKRKLPSPGFQVEVVLADYIPILPGSPSYDETPISDETSHDDANESSSPASSRRKETEHQDKDDLFSDSEADEPASSESQKEECRQVRRTQFSATLNSETSYTSYTPSNQVTDLANATKNISLGNVGPQQMKNIVSEPKSGDTSSGEAQDIESEFKAMAADASVFTFGDDEDYESE